jgi:hypothetical protein
MENKNTPQTQFENIDPKNMTPQQQAQFAVQRFKGLPQKAQIAIGAVFAFFVLSFLLGGGDDAPQVTAPQAEHNDRAVATVSDNETNTDDSFEAAGPSRESLQRGFYAQQRKEIALLKNDLEGQTAKDRQALEEMRTSAVAQQQQMNQMMRAFNDQIRTFQESNNLQRAELSRLVGDARRQQDMQSRTKAMNADEIKPQVRRRISQTTLGGAGGGVNANPNQALLSVGKRAVKTGTNDLSNGTFIQREAEPFLPPLGFIKGTMLNGVDALVGRSTPSLVRLSGTYKTAMNSTVSLDGCIALIELEGEISTERAIGKPSRMTCVYPDRGAVTYALSGYVVDAYDGIVGVPGVFYEGDASRLAAAMMGDFAAGMAQIIQETQFTTETSTGGTATNLTGDKSKAEVAAGISGAMSSLRDYLFERANRVVPFIRIDSTRDLHLVLLSGIELRSEGSAWTLLVDGKKADAVKAANEAARAEAEQQQQP